MLLIIDSGSTKAEWAVLNEKKILFRACTEGFNPNYNKDLSSIISLNKNILSFDFEDITFVHYYGSGCSAEANIDKVEETLSKHFLNAKISVDDDMLAACHALFGDKKGVAAILGTGSNCCLFDGKKITKRAASLGFLIGDEGGGSHLGKNILQSYFYETMPESLRIDFYEAYHLDIKQFIENLYHKNLGAKYLASFAEFAGKHQENPFMESLVYQCFQQFVDLFIKKIEPLDDVEVGFVGSIAFYFKRILEKCLKDNNLKLGKILKEPMDGLIEKAILFSQLDT